MKIKDLPLPMKIYKKHRNMYSILCIITWILFIPFVILQYLYELLEVVVELATELRNKIIKTIFKTIYKKEIIKLIESEED